MQTDKCGATGPGCSCCHCRSGLGAAKRSPASSSPPPPPRPPPLLPSFSSAGLGSLYPVGKRGEGAFLFTIGTGCTCNLTR